MEDAHFLYINILKRSEELFGTERHEIPTIIPNKHSKGALISQV